MGAHTRWGGWWQAWWGRGSVMVRNGACGSEALGLASSVQRAIPRCLPSGPTRATCRNTAQASRPGPQCPPLGVSKEGSCTNGGWRQLALTGARQHHMQRHMLQPVSVWLPLVAESGHARRHRAAQVRRREAGCGGTRCKLQPAPGLAPRRFCSQTSDSAAGTPRELSPKLPFEKLALRTSRPAGRNGRQRPDRARWRWV